MPLTLPLRTPRLTLRRYRADDVAATAAVYADPGVARFLLEEPWTPQQASERVQQRIERAGLDTPARALALVIEAEGRLVGDLALWLVDDTDRHAEISWVLAPDAAGRGYAAEAAAALLEAAFVHHGLHRVQAQLDARNRASARLAERLGMIEEAHQRQNWWSKGEWTDTLIYAVLDADRAAADGRRVAADAENVRRAP